MTSPRPAALESPLVVASNRGPVSFQRNDEGVLIGERGSGGLVTALAGVLFESDATWLAAAMTDGDHEVAASGHAIDVEPAGRAAFVDVPKERYDGYYNGVSNRVLWQLHHYLFDLSYLPSWDVESRQIWDDYREVNRLFAQALDQHRDREPVYLVQDYQLSMVPGLLRELRPDARIAHFTHTPFAAPAYMRVLPGQFREDLLRGMLGADVLGFQAEQWAENFLLSARDSLPDVRVDMRRRRVDVGDRRVLVRTYPVSLDPGPLRATARSTELKALRRRSPSGGGDAKLLLGWMPGIVEERVARVQAHESFWPIVRTGTAVCGSGAVAPVPVGDPSTSSRPAVPRAVDSINAKFGTADWEPSNTHRRDYAQRSPPTGCTTRC
jgi:trehalose 6-phosphate synthase